MHVLNWHCTCINIVCHCSLLQEECWWNLPCKYPKKKNVLPSFNVACFTAFVTYGLYRKQKHSHFLCKLLSIFHIFLIFTRVCWYLDIYFFSLYEQSRKENKGNIGLTYRILNVLCSLVFLFTKIRPVILFCFFNLFKAMYIVILYWYNHVKEPYCRSEYI